MAQMLSRICMHVCTLGHICIFVVPLNSGMVDSCASSMLLQDHGLLLALQHTSRLSGA